MQDVMHHGPTESSFRSIGIQLLLPGASGGVIHILDDSPLCSSEPDIYKHDNTGRRGHNGPSPAP